MALACRSRRRRCASRQCQSSRKANFDATPWRRAVGTARPTTRCGRACGLSAWSTRRGIAPATALFSTATTRSSTSCRRWSARARSAATSSSSRRSRAVATTAARSRWRRPRRVVVAQVLAELGTSYVDLLLLHHVCTTHDETLLAWRVLEAALGRGRARAVGVSSFDTPDLSGCSASRRARRRNRVPLCRGDGR